MSTDIANQDRMDLVPSFLLHLRGERKSAQTIKSYAAGLRSFASWCDRAGVEAALDPPTVDKFTVSLMDEGAEPSTARLRQLAVRRYSAWLAAEGEVDEDQLARLRPPRLDVKAVTPLSDDQLRALLAACKGGAEHDKRDEAIIRLLAETGIRAGELLALTVDDVDLVHGLALITREKGGKARRVPFGPKTGAAVDRYLRARRHHRLAGTSTLWLGTGGKEFRYGALRKTLSLRARAAGIGHLNAHLFRHTAADRWLTAGGSEQGLMAVAAGRGRKCWPGTQRRGKSSGPRTRPGRWAWATCECDVGHTRLLYWLLTRLLPNTESHDHDAPATLAAPPLGRRSRDPGRAQPCRDTRRKAPAGAGGRAYPLV